MIALIILLMCSTGLLLWKLIALYQSLNMIGEDVHWILSEDTNQQIRMVYSDRRLYRLVKRLEEDLLELRRNRLAYEKGNAELKNAVANISHDLRTPLTAIIGYTELMLEKDRPEDETRYLTIIHKRCDNLRKLTDELFNYSVTVVEPDGDIILEDVDIRDVIAQCLADFYPDLNSKNILPVIHLPDKPVVQKLNQEYLLRIFANLISNAIKYSDGDLIIDLSETGEIQFQNHAKKLDKVQTERLFDRFYTLDSSRESTGLGLSVAKLLVERMNGRIDSVYEDGILKIMIGFY